MAQIGIEEHYWLKELGIETMYPDKIGYTNGNCFPKLESQRIVPQHRLLMARRTAPDPKTVNRSIGYKNVSQVIQSDISINGFNGSSLNREYGKLIKQQRLQNFAAFKKRQEEFNIRMVDYSKFQSVEDKDLFPLQVDLRKDKRFRRPSGIGKVKSTRTVNKIQEKCYSFLRICNEPSFVTLTFIQEISDRKATAILNAFFASLKKKFPKIESLWVAERQNKNNGRVHFHVIFSRKMPVQKINAMWVLAQYNAGLSHYKIPKQEIWDRYDKSMLQKGNKPVKGSIGEKLNPVNIQRIRNNDGLSLYITKYVTKSGGDSFDCRTWHCSRKVSRLFTKMRCDQSVIDEADTETNCRVDVNGKLITPKTYQSNFFLVRPIINKDHFYKYLKHLEDMNNVIMDGVDIGKRELIYLFEELNLN